MFLSTHLFSPSKKGAFFPIIIIIIINIIRFAPLEFVTLTPRRERSQIDPNYLEGPTSTMCRGGAKMIPASSSTGVAGAAG